MMIWRKESEIATSSMKYIVLTITNLIRLSHYSRKTELYSRYSLENAVPIP